MILHAIARVKVVCKQVRYISNCSQFKTTKAQCGYQTVVPHKLELKYDYLKYYLIVSDIKTANVHTKLSHV